jgi:hypothetical protein
MVKKMEEIYCKDCGQKLSKDDKICPNCGGKERNIFLRLEEKIEIHDQIKGRLKAEGAKKPVLEFKAGDNFHRESGKWYDREMIINRREDSYKEIIKDKVTGGTVHECEEPLSKHIGHGSAKHKNKINED